MTDEEAQLLEAIEEHFEEIVCGDKVEPKIVLTVEEAKELEAMIYDFLETFEKHFDVPEWNSYVKLHQLLEKRIKQTEGE